MFLVVYLSDFRSKVCKIQIICVCKSGVLLNLLSLSSLTDYHFRNTYNKLLRKVPGFINSRLKLLMNLQANSFELLVQQDSLLDLDIISFN